MVYIALYHMKINDIYKQRSNSIYRCIILIHNVIFNNLQFTIRIIKGSLDEKLPIYEQDPKSKRLDSFEKRFVRD